MRNTTILSLAAASATLLAGIGAQAQTYSNAVAALNPAGYWPLNETTVPSGGLYIATNLGSLGAAGQGYYETFWTTNANTLVSTNTIVHTTGAIVGDSDTALLQGSVGNFVVVPRTTNGVANSAVTLTPPFTIEAWVYPTNNTANQLKPFFAEGFNNVQAPEQNYATQTKGVALGMFSGFIYFNTWNGTGTKTEIDTAALAMNQWYHIVATFDGTTMRLYTNGNLRASANPPGNAFGTNYMPDLVSPMIIGGGNELGQSGGANVLFGGAIDEVAVYKAVLSQTQATNHYSNGTNGSRSTAYSATVLADNPAMYFKLDEPAFAGAGAPTSYPSANNYGTVGAAGNGYYLPGSTPGVAGPNYPGFGGASSKAVAFNGFNSAVDVGAGSLPASLNPTGNQPLTVAAWFKGYPSDCVGRLQTLVGHSDASWRLNLDVNAGVQFNPGNGPQLSFSSINDEFANGAFVNDGNWHFVAASSDGTNDALYIDGNLVKSGTAAGAVTGSALDLLLGSDPQYLILTAGSANPGGRWFDGALSQVAFFTNALTSSQIQGLYAAAGVPPSIRVQPASEALALGTNASIPSIVSGSSPITYTWYRNGSVASGQTSSALTFTPVNSGSAGSYYLVAGNTYGTVTSAVITVSVYQPNSSTYGSAIRSLNPAAYWPLDETIQPPYGQYIATNLGTSGAGGNGYYETWFQPIANGVVNTFYQTNNVPRTNGPIADGDTAMQCFRSAAGTGSYVIFPRSTNGVPNPALNLTPPFSLELWVHPDTTNAGTTHIISQGHNPVLDPATGYSTTNWEGFTLGQFNGIWFFACWNDRGGDSTKQELDTAIVTNQWQHLVLTFDGTNQTWFKNGAQAATRAIPASAANSFGQLYVPDLISPLLIGTGSEPSAGQGGTEFAGAIDEVAIYTNILPAGNISSHYTAGSATGTTYRDTVVADNPVIYLRLNDAPFNSYPAGSSYPTATNYGFIGASANGAYQPGTVPGVNGPSGSGFGGTTKAVAINGHSGAVDIGGGVSVPQLNPTGPQPFTVATWFQANPADAPARFQDIIGRGNNSWRITLDNVSGGLRFNPGNNPELQFTNNADVLANDAVANDGRWHFVAGVSDGSTASLYFDGRLVKSASGVGSLPVANVDAFLGGDPQFTTPSFNTPNTLRYFDGQVAQVSFFTNALNASQIQQLYTVAGAPVVIVQQPPAVQTNNVGDNVNIPVLAHGSTPSYQWYQSNTTTHALSPVAGQTNSNLVFNPVAQANAGYYALRVSNSYNAVTSSVVQLVIVGPPQVVNQSPTTMKVFVGTTPTLHVTTLGANPVYQWSSNNVAVGASAPDYTLPTNATQVAGTYTYRCTVSNSFGSASITPISLQVIARPVAPYPVAVLGDKPIAYFRLSETDDGLGNNGATTWDYAGGNNGVYTNALLGQAGYAPTAEATNTAAEFGDYGAANNYAGNVPTYLNFATTNGSSATFSVEAWVNKYLFANGGNCIAALGTGNGGEQFVLDTGSTGGSVRFFVRNAAGATASAANTAFTITDSQWHHLVGVCDQPNGHVYLYLDGQQVASGTITAGTGILNPTAPLSIGARQSAANGNYDYEWIGKLNDVAVYNYALSAGQALNHYLSGQVPPTITSINPPTQDVNQSTTATITVAVNGSAPLTYTWYDPNFNPIPGATGATLTLTNVQVSQSGTYTVQVANNYGTASTNAFLNVNQGPPVFDVDLQPLNATVYASTPVTYSVVVSGSPPFTYRWYRNGSLLVGVTGATNTFVAAQGTNTYQVGVSNQYSGGSQTLSSIATLVGMPSTTLNPSNYTDRIRINFTGYNRPETLKDFPVLVRLSNSRQGFNYSHFASGIGGDLRFTDSSGTRVIPHEIDEWNTAGESTVWVQVPSLSGSNDFIYAYWGNGSAITPPAGTNVWIPQTWEGNPSYQIVYHLKESAFPYADSTMNFPALTGVATTPAAGIVGTGGTFNSSYLDAGTVTLADQNTVSTWVNIDPAATSIQTTWCNQQGGFGKAGFALFADLYQTSDKSLRLASGNGTTGKESATATGVVPFGSWHLLTATIDRTNGTSHLYVDGTDLGSYAVQADYPTTADLNLGRFLDGNFYLRGMMDEARVHSTLESSNWVWASYMTVASNTAFASYSSVTSTVPAGIGGFTNVSFQVTNGKLIISGTALAGAAAANVQYQVLSSTNVTLPLASWTAIATNAFDSSGNLRATNNIDATKPKVFFRLVAPQ